MTESTSANRPDSITAAFRLLISALTRERAMFLSGALGILLGISGLVIAGIHGPVIEPEGILKKAIAFDIALGIYVWTLALFLPIAGFSRRGGHLWRAAHVFLVFTAYGFENIQIGRGLDPRFSTHGTPVDNMLGGVFFLNAVVIFILFVILAVKIFKSKHAKRSVLLASKYAFATAMIGFAAGFWMSFGQGPTNSGASILPMHAVGFHGLQAVPLVALILGWTGISFEASKMQIHFAGLAWLSACLTIVTQTVMGRTLTEFSAMPILTILFLAGWGILFLNVLNSWRISKNAPPAFST